MTMLPNYILSVTSVVFLIYSFVHLRIGKAEVSNKLVYGIALILALVLLGMSVYGIVFHIPLSQVQALIESKFR